MLSQAPQLFTSVVRSTAAAPGVHCVWVMELAVQAPARQICCAPQTVPQAPQLSWAVVLSVQTLSQAILLGPPQLITHSLATQVVAPALPVGVSQAPPQKPQLAGSVARVAQ